MWLAVHEGLEEYRAIKHVPKQLVDYETFRKEALILKELHHPGIPVVYDLEEDQDYFYLIEEYLEGQSLYALIEHQGALQEAEAVRYGIQICSLVHFMHSSSKHSILHLDLQPNNLIICGGTVRLIDFDHAASIEQANATAQRYGTKGCAAPEQYTSDQTLDQRTDIYAIGAVLQFMVHATQTPEGTPHAPISETLAAIIRKCTAQDAGMRFSTAQEVGEALERLRISLAADKTICNAVPVLHIVLTGNRPGAGATHLAFGLCRYLTRLGYQVLYEEHNSSGALRALIKAERLRTDGYGICHFQKCSLKPWFGPAACLPEPKGFDIIVKDFGTQWKEAGAELARGERLQIAAACESLWEKGLIEQLLEQTGGLEQIGVPQGLSSKQTILVFRHVTKRRFKLSELPGILRGKHSSANLPPVFRSPEYENPFQPGSEADTFLKGLWEAVCGKTAIDFGAETKAEKRQMAGGSWESPEPDGERG